MPLSANSPIDSKHPDDSAVGPWESDAAFLSQIIETQSDIAAVELDLGTIMRLVAQRTQRLTGADGASVHVVDGDHLTCREASGMMEDVRGTRFALKSSLAALVARSGQFAYCEDADSDERVDREQTARLGIRSFILVPICHGAQVVGVLNVSSRSPAAFNPRDISALRLMAGLVAAAIAHSAEFETKKQLLAQRTKALAALRDSEERFRSAFDHAAIGMALVGLDGRWLQVNRSICQIVGFTEHELLVRDFQSITHPDDLDADLALVRRLIAGEIQDYQMVKRYIHRQRHLVWVLLSVSLVRDADGKPLHFIAQIQDVTRSKETEDALRASENEYRATFEMAGVGKAQVNLETRAFVRVNQKLCDMLGYSPNELKALTFLQITHPDDIARCREAAMKMRSGKQTEFSTDKRFLCKNGRILWVTLSATVLLDANGQPQRAVCTYQDVTQRRLAEQLERDRRRVLEMVARDMPLPAALAHLAASVEAQLHNCVTGVFVLQDGDVLLHGPTLSPKWRKTLQANALQLAAGLAAQTWTAADRCGVSFVDEDEIWKDLRPIALAYNIQSCWTTAIQGNDASPLGLLLTFCHDSRRPTTAETETLDMAAKLAAICIEHHNTTRKLGHLVRHDALTSLPNRIMFEDRLQHALDLAARSQNQVGVLLMDIDKFKSINDTFGHQTGDALLQQFAQRLSNVLRDTDTMARLGGDEFVVVLPELKARAAAAVVAQKLLSSLSKPFTIADHTLQVTASIGIAVYPDNGASSVSLQKRADEALYRVKQQGRNGFGF